MPKAKKESEPVVIPSIMFLDKEGKETTIDKVLVPEDYWLKKSKKGNCFIIKHGGVEKIAEIAGIKPLINTESDLDTSPKWDNAQTTVVISRLFCETNFPIKEGEESNGKCIHGTDKKFRGQGEASRLTSASPYYRTMAEKRAYDRAVLQHLKLTSKVSIYSEDESPDFEEEKGVPIDDVIVKLREVVNRILNATSKEDLLQIANWIKTQEYNEQELEYLRGLWFRMNNAFTETF